jgi:hypothetical protein
LRFTQQSQLLAAAVTETNSSFVGRCRGNSTDHGTSDKFTIVAVVDVYNGISIYVCQNVVCQTSGVGGKRRGRWRRLSASCGAVTVEVMMSVSVSVADVLIVNVRVVEESESVVANVVVAVKVLVTVTV